MDIKTLNKLFDTFSIHEMERLSHFFNWKKISCSNNFHHLNFAFIHYFSHKFNWQFISAYPYLSSHFIKAFKNKIVWEEVKLYHTLSEQFIDEFSEYLIDEHNNLDLIFNKHLNENIIRKYSTQFNFDWNELSITNSLSKDFIHDFKDKLSWKALFYNPFMIHKWIDFPKYFWFQCYYHVIHTIDTISNDLNWDSQYYQFTLLFIDSDFEIHTTLLNILDYWKTMIKIINIAASVIQKFWKFAISNPKYIVCKNRLTNEFNTLIHSKN